VLIFFYSHTIDPKYIYKRYYFYNLLLYYVILKKREETKLLFKIKHSYINKFNL